jgi:predicted transglutaminase-like cysteine proteinase
MSMKSLFICCLCLTLAACASRTVAPPPRFSSFETNDIPSADLTPFTKWTGVLARIDASAAAWPWRHDDAALRGLSRARLAQKVNDAVNAYKFIDDASNWHTSDYWETPAEFIARGGGDCEGFAIAKYAWLRSLGIPENDLRLLVAYDRYTRAAHTLLTVRTQDGVLYLDNQFADTRGDGVLTRYQPLYSINRDAWWRHI